MHPAILQMLAVQDLDKNIQTLQAELKPLPGQIAALHKDLEQRAGAIKKLADQAAALAAKRRERELEMKTREQQLAKFRNQQAAVKTPKEFEAMNHEVEKAEADISALEEEILKSMDEEDRLGVEVHKRQADLKLHETKAAEQEQRIREIEGEKKQLLHGLSEDRIVAANRLDPDHRDTYEWLLKNHGPTAVTRISGDACGGCGGMLIADLAVKVRLGKDLIQCDHCTRFLYAPGKD
ncbi:MAG: hypothetical protein K1X53_06870 [Candidatus Sumerlaeaceae bacterium]|nr:hypothetical protein [Candidatus Sumerlaeaceae bacterium]